MASHQPVEADPKEVQRAQDLWSGFMTATKYSIIAIIGLLVLLCAAFIR